MTKGLRSKIPIKDIDPEEGEIVDDYEFILSSDEELDMRRRINELEATNEELAKIARISYQSEAYNSKNATRMCISHNTLLCSDNNNVKDPSCRCERQLPSDVSSISSGEFLTPIKLNREKTKMHRKKILYNQPKHLRLRQQNCRHHYEYHRKKRRTKYSHSEGRRIRSDQKWKTIALHSVRKKRCSYHNMDQSSSVDDSDEVQVIGEDGNLNREKLRFALARSPNNRFTTSSLMERLGREKLTSNVQRKENCAYSDKFEKIDNDSDHSLEEQELRLIALKSAIIKKHLARKKRNAEAAYSPTDFDDMLVNTNSFDDSIDIVHEVEFNDLQAAGMAVSPVVSPKTLNGEQKNEYVSPGCTNTGDTKIVDMDISNSESDCEVQRITEENFNWGIINPIPLTNRSNDVNTNIPKTKNAPLVPYDMYIQAIQYNDSPPMPDIAYCRYVPPPPPPFCFSNLNHHNTDIDGYSVKSMDDKTILSSSNTEKCQKDNMCNQDSNARELQSTLEEEFIPSMVKKSKKSLEHLNHSANESNQESDEEEKALRALLLAKMQCPMNFRRKTVLRQNQKQNDYDGSEELCSYISEQQLYHTIPSETILKEAVRRLSNKSCPESSLNSSINKEVTLVNSLNQNGVFVNENSGEQNLYLSSQSISIEPKSRLFHKTNSNKKNYKNDNMKNDFKEEGETENADFIVKCNSKTSKIAMCDVQSETKEEESFEICLKSEANSGSPENIQTKLFDSEISHLQQSNLVESIVSNIRECKIKTINTEVPINNDINHLRKNEIEDLLNTDVCIANPSETSKLETTSNLRAITTTNVLESAKSSLIDDANTLKRISSVLPTKKIIKRNKIINTNQQIKRRHGELPNELPKAKESSLSLPSLTQPKICDKSRLITSANLPALQVQKLIISLRSSDSDSDVSKSDIQTNNGTQDQSNDLVQTIFTSTSNGNYYNNDSPISLRMNSPDYAASSYSGGIEVTDAKRNRIISGEIFEQKLNNYLQHCRYQENQRNAVENMSMFASNSAQQNNSEKLIAPLAVRHLPKNSQLEYRRLVHRMNMLQKRKQTKNHSAVNIQKTQYISSQLSTSNVKNVAKNEPQGCSTSKELLATLQPSTSSAKQELTKISLLHSYESSYMKIGAGIVTNLDKSLHLVQEAKKIKISKLRHEKRLKELQVEMDEVRCKYKEELQKISKVYPAICVSNNVITSLKQRRFKLFKYATSLGKNIIGEEYRLNNELKRDISLKTHKLAANIKLVNSLKPSDLHQFQDTLGVMEKQKVDVHISKIISNKSEILEIGNISSGCQNQSKDAISTQETKLSKNYKEDNTQMISKENIEIQRDRNAPKHHTKSLQHKQQTEGHVTKLTEYVSPLLCTKDCNIKRKNLDPNGIICPYELMGQCKDDDCTFMHLDNKTSYTTSK